MSARPSRARRLAGLCWLLVAAHWLTACSVATTAPPHLFTHCNAAAGAPQFRLLGEVRWDVDAQYGGVPVGGLSSIDWDAARGQFVMVSDDRSVHGPARFYSARMRYDASGLHEVWLTGMHGLRGPDQQTYANARQARPHVPVPDAEALRIVPGTDRMLWTSEGDFARGFGPELNEIGSDGRWIGEWPLPSMLRPPANPIEAANTGPRNAFTLEGMSFSPDGRTLWLSMEGALRQDGAMPSPGHSGAPVRITALDAKTSPHAPIRQIAYQPDALADDIALLPQRAINGVSDILADGPDHLLVLERSFSLGQGWGARLYRIDIRPGAATDVLPMQALVPGQYRSADKTLVLDFARLGLRSLDNLEGMSWGPPLPGGERVLVLVSDNNFNPAEVTQFIALAEQTVCTAD
ncbi:esterase-like activity of phytase family protein [Diaphorobacter aerolatus]|uniref:Esterase-like activity of phytase family protein n=1 Tax=Diaphorobacter aerolatus TaxID=1288495 RepID=A0A7H0GPB1_9BURK|nr:esterase-like activity of phytase family protein [Diaphorobacter aerolatus]QNP50127.1 esterase-like activity of phytase family protein [Diaphorobacter aerolatus]